MNSEVLSTFDDPKKILHILGRNLKIQTVDDRLCIGHVYVIDPETKTVILKTCAGGIKIIMFKAISNAELLPIECKNVNCCDISRSNMDNIVENSALAGKRKEVFVKWFKDNLINLVDEGSVLKCEDYLFIEHPFRCENIYCSNTIILERMKTVMDKVADIN